MTWPAISSCHSVTSSTNKNERETMNTETMIQAQITSKDAFGNPVTRGGSFDSLATMAQQIELFVGAANLISIEITSNK